MKDHTRPRTRAAPGPVPLGLMRTVVTLHAVTAIAQPVLAGQFLNGNFDMLDYHSANASLVTLLALCQVVAAVLLRWPGRGPLWPILVSVLLVVAESMQATLGYLRMLDLHIPLGVAIVGTTGWMLFWVWRPHLGRTRVEEAGHHVTVAP